MAVESESVPRRDVRRLPDTAESIFWPAEMSILSGASLDLLMVTVGPDPGEFGVFPCPRAEEDFSSVLCGSDTNPDIQ